MKFSPLARFGIVLMTIIVTILGTKVVAFSVSSENPPFKGEGTVNEPYLIESAEDLSLFRDSVNSGFDYRDRYFAQTADIDLIGIENWTPIGVFGGGCYFYGVYNGVGHTISNLNIKNGGNGGLFGALGGTVMNLGIESGHIDGDCVGSVASHATADGVPKILNCYNKASVHGDTRAGGIADNFGTGYIMNCWNTGEVTSGVMAGGIACLSASRMYNSYSVGIPVVPENFSGTIRDCAQISPGDWDVLSVAGTLNAKLHEVGAMTRYTKNELRTWIPVSGSLFYGDAYSHKRNILAKEALVITVTLIAAALAAFLWLRYKRIGMVAAIKQGVYPGGGLRGRLQVLVLGIFGLCAFLVSVALFCGDHAVLKAFFNDNSPFIDFFPVLYAPRNGIWPYPPLAIFVFWLLNKAIPAEIEAQRYQIARAASLDVSGYDVMFFLSVLFICLLAIWFCIYKQGQAAPYRKASLAFFMVFCSPMIFAIHTGNVIILAFLLSLLFVLGYNSNSKIVAMLSYACLAMAVGIKLYPAVLGLILIRERRWKGTIVCICFGLIVGGVSFYSLGGLDGLMPLIKMISDLTDYFQSFKWPNTYMIDYTNALRLLLQSFTGNHSLQIGAVSYTVYPIMALLLAVAALVKEKWKSLLSLTLVLVMFPGMSNLYTGIFYIIPLTSFFYEEHERKIDYVYALLLCGMLVPLQFLCGVVGVPTSAIWLFVSVCELLIILLLFADAGWVLVLARRNPSSSDPLPAASQTPPIPIEKNYARGTNRTKRKKRK